MSQEHFYRGDAATSGPAEAPAGHGQAPPGYGPPPEYGPPPGYEAPGYGPPPGYPGAWRRPTNTMAILALVLAFVVPPAGIVLGVMARKQIRQTGEEGDGLALAGIIVGSLVTGLYLLMILGLLFLIPIASTSVTVGP